MEGPISFWGYKEQELNLILPEHDDDDDDDDDDDKEVTFKNKTRPTLPIYIDALTNCVHNTYHYADMTYDMALCYCRIFQSKTL